MSSRDPSSSSAVHQHQSENTSSGATRTTTDYVEMQQHPTIATSTTEKQRYDGDKDGLTSHEIETLRKFLRVSGTSALQQQQQQAYHDTSIDRNNSNVTGGASLDSEYPEFMESTHAWAIFAGNPKKRASKMDRLVGTMIIAFQLFTYWMFATEAIEDYEKGQVVVTTRHATCLASNEEPEGDFLCEAEFTSNFDAFVAFFMLGIFLAGDVLQAGRVIKNAPRNTSMIFAILAAIEVISAYIAACIAVSYNLYIGEVTDAVEVGVGLLFIRELSQRAYAGIRQGETKQYKSFFTVLGTLVAIGMLMDPLCEHLFAVKE